MKHRGNTCLFHEEREAAVLDAYIKIKDLLPSKEIYKAIGEGPSPRFWISEERAAIVYGMYRDGWTMTDVLPRRRLLYIEICNRIEELMKDNEEYNCSEAAYIAVRQEAPSFYLSPSSIGTILNRALRKRSHGMRGRLAR